jgi:hypothetical protein
MHGAWCGPRGLIRPHHHIPSLPALPNAQCVQRPSTIPRPGNALLCTPRADGDQGTPGALAILARAAFPREQVVPPAVDGASARE